jgi:hypothetical protein
MKFIFRILLFITVLGISLGSALTGCDETKTDNTPALLILMSMQPQPVPTKIYIFSTPAHNGKLGGRTGANNLCRSAQRADYAFLNGKTVKAFLSVSANDQIKDLVPVKYQNLPVFGVITTDTLAGGTQLKDQWAHLWNGTGILVSMDTATDAVAGGWLAGSNNDGTFIDKNSSCNGWTYSKASSPPAAVGGDSISSAGPDQWINWIGTSCDAVLMSVMCVAY